jgi:hypothetical protein
MVVASQGEQAMISRPFVNRVGRLAKLSDGSSSLGCFFGLAMSVSSASDRL